MGRKRTTESNLPPNVYLKAGSYYFVTPGPKRKWINLGKIESNISAALYELASIYKSAETSKSAYGTIISSAYNRCKGGAKKRRLEFKITRRNIEDLYIASGGRCQLTGIKFCNDKIGNASVRPWCAIIDRIDSSKGYTIDNIRLVCASVNTALGEWGDEALLKIIKEGHKNIFQTKTNDDEII